MDVDGLQLVEDVRALIVPAQSVIRRVGGFRKGRGKFTRVNEHLADLSKKIEDVISLVRNVPRAIPEDVSADFVRLVGRARQTLLDMDTAMEMDFATAFAGTGSSFLKHVKSSTYRIFRGPELNAKIRRVEGQVEEISDQLVHISITLQGCPRLETLDITEFTKDRYLRVTIAPRLSHLVMLNVDVRDAEGHITTPEGALKYNLLSGDSLTIAAAGKIPPAYGVVGMAGVGKSTAMQGLAYDEDIRIRFSDGILYMNFGRGATLDAAIREIAGVMRGTGGVTQGERVEMSTSLQEAVDRAVAWFRGKNCLFLIDDLWPTEQSTTGYMNELRQLLRSSLDSRMAISTRIATIAVGTGAVVKFGGRDPFGEASMGIFMNCATKSISSDRSQRDGMSLLQCAFAILSFCRGVPIALSVAGCAVDFLVRKLGKFDAACKSYVSELNKGKIRLEDECEYLVPTLERLVLQSLNYLQICFLDLKKKKDILIQQTIADLYISLSVLRKQQWIPVSYLSRLWKLDEHTAFEIVRLFKGMSLAALSFREIKNERRTEAGLTMHDLLHDFCISQWKSKDNAHTSFSLPISISGLDAVYSYQKSVEESEWSLQSSSNIRYSAIVPLPGHEKVVFSQRNTGTLHTFNLKGSEKEFRFAGDNESVASLSCRSSSCESMDTGRRGQETEFITSLRCARNGARVVSGARDGAVRLWNVETARNIGRTPSGHSGHVLSVAISGDGFVLISGCLQGTVQLTKCQADDRFKSKVEKFQNPIRSVCISENGRRAISCSGNTICVWSTRLMKPFYTLPTDSDDEISCIDVSKSGQYLVSGSSTGTLILWDLKTRRRERQPLLKLWSRISCISISGDGQRLAASSWDGNTRVFNLFPRAQIGAPIRLRGDWPNVSLNEDGRLLVVWLGDNVAVWNFPREPEHVDQIAENL